MERMNRAVRKIDPTRYRRLLSRAMPVVIETEEENERMLAVVEKLMEKGEAISPEEEKLLKLLARLIEDFEEQYYHPREATPLRSFATFDGIARSKTEPSLGSIRIERYRFGSPEWKACD
jgi:hypothetical protein